MNTANSVKKCVIPTAGYGTRLFPATKAIPKAFFPIVDVDGIAKPIIHIIINEAISSGIDEVCIITQKDQLENLKGYFSQKNIPFSGPEIDKCLADIIQMGERITYVIQKNAMGFGHAVYCAKDFVGKEPFLVLLGDHIYISNTQDTCSKQVISVFVKYGLSVTSVARTHESQLRFFGAVNGKRIDEKTIKVETLKEKPTPEYARSNLRVEGLEPEMYLCNFGIDVLTPKIMEILDYNIKNDIRQRGEFQLRDAMETLIEKEGLYAYEVNGQRYDIGVPEEFIKTISIFGLKSCYGSDLKPVITDQK